MPRRFPFSPGSPGPEALAPESSDQRPLTQATATHLARGWNLP